MSANTSGTTNLKQALITRRWVPQQLSNIRRNESVTKVLTICGTTLVCDSWTDRNYNFRDAVWWKMLGKLRKSWGLHNDNDCWARLREGLNSSHLLVTIFSRSHSVWFWLLLRCKFGLKGHCFVSVNEIKQNNCTSHSHNKKKSRGVSSSGRTVEQVPTYRRAVLQEWLG